MSDHSHTLASRGWIAAIGLLIAAKAALLVTYALRARWVMDEFAQGYSSRLLDAGLYTKVDPIKTVLPLFVFRLPYEWTSSATHILTAWRVETLLAAVLLAACVALATWRIRGSAVAALVATLVVLSFSNFMERAFRVRNDSFAVLPAMVALVVLLGDRETPRKAWLVGFLSGMAFLCTQKSIYFVAAFGLGLWVSGWSSGRWRGAMATLSRYAAGAGLPLLAYCVAFGGARFDRVLTAVFLSPLQPGFSTAFAHPGLGRYVVQTLERNAFVYLLCGIGLATAFVHWRRSEPRLRAAALTTAVVTVGVFLHSQPWPYVFVMAMPFLAVWAPFPLPLTPQRFRATVLFVIVVSLSFSFLRNVTYLNEDETAQFEVVRTAESLLGRKDRYFDGIGMIPTREIAGRHPWWWWDAPMLEILRERWNAGDRTEIERILNDHPKVWILNYRFRPMAPILAPIWQAGTVRVSPYLLVSGRQATGRTSVNFENLWPGTYDLFDAQGGRMKGKLRVDGSLCELPCSISTGRHDVTTDRNAFLLPVDFQGRGPIPYRGGAPDLFAEIYDF